MAEAQPGEAPGRPAFQRLRPQVQTCAAEELVASFGLWERPAEPAPRPRVLLNMVSTADGRATRDGRSGTISGAADRALFHALRAPADAVMVGAGTLRTESYGRIVPDPAVRALRAQRGLADEPLACVVSGRLALDESVPLLREPDARVVILTGSAASLPAPAAHVDYVRTGEDGALDLPGALGELAARFGVQTLLCEGGPHLARRLFGEGLIDELFLSLSPLLAGGEPAAGQALRILAGSELEPPVELELLDAATAGSSLFLRYGVSARARVSAETTESSSLAS